MSTPSALGPLFALAVLALGVTARAAGLEDDQRFQQSQRHMGAKFEVIFYAPNAAAADLAFEAVFDRVKELDQMMSDYDPESELSRLSKASPTSQPRSVSRELRDVLAQAQSLSRRTDGAFDVTVGPLTRLWRRARRQKKMPDPSRLDEARRAVGYELMLVDFESSKVALRRPRMCLDLGGIAKGYAADAMLEVLKGRRIDRALVNAGGDVVVSGAPPGQIGWKVEIAPLGESESPSEFLMLSNAGVATSGDAWQSVEIDGVRYSHIVDPHTGLGTTRRGGVTVVANDGTTSDSLASALNVMDIDAGLQLVDQISGASAFIVWEADGKLHERRSRSFPARQ
jgi:thiamine biosynthesis lipoprotein